MSRSYKVDIVIWLECEGAKVSLKAEVDGMLNIERWLTDVPEDTDLRNVSAEVIATAYQIGIRQGFDTVVEVAL